MLSLVGVDLPDAARHKAAAFRCILLLVIAVEAVDLATRWYGDESFAGHALLALVAVTGALLAWMPSRAGLALALVAGAVVADFLWQFPGNANHQYLQLVCLALFGVLRLDVDDEVELLTTVLRWLFVIGMLWAGTQKLLHGYYFDGTLLAFAVSGNERFASLLGPLLPSAELERLRALQLLEGAGPYRADSAVFVAVSNLAVVAELVLPVLLLFNRTRLLGVAGALAFFVCIEAAAREVFFGGLMVAFALLFTDRLLVRCLPGFVFAYLYVAAMSLGFVPRWFFS